MYKSLSLALLACAVCAAAAQAAEDVTPPTLLLHDVAGQEVRSFTDGTAITFELSLSRAPAEQATYGLFLLPEGVEVAACDLPARATSCRSGPIDTLGWAWSGTGARLPKRHLELRTKGEALVRLAVDVATRPVVLVHGFTSSASAWSSYGGPDGFLADMGIEAYVVGDPLLGPPLDMGRTTTPTAETNTIAENAAVLASAIEAVRARTGATLVDVVAHSMGGLVARYYLARLMEERSVAQLLMLGTPNLGSPCAALPSALGFYLPAALELRPSYLEAVFNAQVSGTGGVPVETLAGTPITERFRSPCTDVPSDLVVDRTSAAGAGGLVTELPVLHTDLTSSVAVFESFVAPRLRTAPAHSVGAQTAGTAPTSAQATHVYSGTVAPGDSVTFDIDLDAVAVAAFALFDPWSSLAVEVHGASGARVELTPDGNGFFTVADPESLVHLGYGFENPRPGTWQVTLRSEPGTPAAGAPFALTARVVGGATVAATVDEFLPAVGEPITVTAVANDIDMVVSEAALVVTGPRGSRESVTMRPVADTWRASWLPSQPGVHGIDVVVTGATRGGLALERTVPLAVEVRDADLAPAWLVVAGVVILACVVTVVATRASRRRRTTRAAA